MGYGYIEFAGAVLLCAGLIVDQGFGPYGAREIAKAPERTAELVSEIVFARFMLALVAYAVVIAFALLLVVIGIRLFTDIAIMKLVEAGKLKAIVGASRALRERHRMGDGGGSMSRRR